MCNISFKFPRGQWVNTLRPSDAYMRQWSNHHWFRELLVAWSAPNHYLNQCWDIVNWTLGNKLQWNLNRNLNVFIQENVFEIVVWKMAAILSRPQWVNSQRTLHSLLLQGKLWMVVCKDCGENDQKVLQQHLLWQPRFYLSAVLKSC